MSFKTGVLHVRVRDNPVLKQKKVDTIFIIIIGDRDILPSVRIALGSNIRVEL